MLSQKSNNRNSSSNCLTSSKHIKKSAKIDSKNTKTNNSPISTFSQKSSKELLSYPYSVQLDFLSTLPSLFLNCKMKLLQQVRILSQKQNEKFNKTCMELWKYSPKCRKNQKIVEKFIIESNKKIQERKLQFLKNLVDYIEYNNKDFSTNLRYKTILLTNSSNNKNSVDEMFWDGEEEFICDDYSNSYSNSFAQENEIFRKQSCDDEIMDIFTPKSSMI